MGAEIINSANGVLTVQLSGTLAQPELMVLQLEVAHFLQEQSGARVLVLAERFEGWEKAGNWGNLSLQMRGEPFIERMAIVGEKRWEDLALLFAAKGLRPFPVECFPADRAAQAQAWLAEKPEARA